VFRVKLVVKFLVLLCMAVAVRLPRVFMVRLE
jgi:hypothetical protein